MKIVVYLDIYSVYFYDFMRDISCIKMYTSNPFDKFN